MKKRLWILPLGVYSVFILLLTALLGLAIGWQPGDGVEAASCSVSGTISTDTIWSPTACDPYIVTGSIVVSSGVTLTVEAGTTVKLDSLKGLLVQGTLLARGTEQNPITFTSNQASPAKGDWNNIHFADSSPDATFDGSGNYAAGSIVQYAIVEYAGSASVGGALYIEDSSPYIDHNTIRNNAKKGILSSYSKPHIYPILITNNVIDGNTGGGISIWTQYSIILDISNNAITRNTGSGGVYAAGLGLASATISGNTVTGNTSGIGAERGMITNNIVTGNTTRGGIAVLLSSSIPGSSDPIVNGNDVYSNTWDTQGQVTPNDFSNSNAAGTAAVDAKNNYWGTTDPNVIADHIWDFTDDSSLGMVDYIPFRTSPISILFPFQRAFLPLLHKNSSGW